MTGFCVKISKSREWGLDYSWHHVGCNGDLNEIGFYEVVDNSFELNHFTYEVRSAFDPLIYIRETTKGKICFGLPSLTWKIMGVVFALLSIFLLVEPAVYFKKRLYGQLPESPKLVEFKSIKK
jgi:hypothetical protein